jgi:hypothetical protein
MKLMRGDKNFGISPPDWFGFHVLSLSHKFKVFLKYFLQDEVFYGKYLSNVFGLMMIWIVLGCL